MTKITEVTHNGDNLIATVILTSSETVEMTGEPLISAKKQYVLPSSSTMEDLLAEIDKDSKRLDGEVQSFSKIKESIGKPIKGEDLSAATAKKEEKEAKAKADKEAAAAAEIEAAKPKNPEVEPAVDEGVVKPNKPE